jgi:hypothetical protein
MGGDYSTFSNESGKDATDKMFALLREEGHEIYFSKRKKNFFVVINQKRRYITVKRNINIYEEVTYDCYLV